MTLSWAIDVGVLVVSFGAAFMFVCMGISILRERK